MSEMIRSFIAIRLDEKAVAALRRAQSLLRNRPAGQAARWGHPEDIHLTLKFLGDVPADVIPEIAESLKTACTPSAPFEIALAGLGCFPNCRQPRVIWAGIKEAAALRNLQGAVEEAMNDLGYAPEERAFSPHLTLARVERNAKSKEVAALGQEVERAGLGEIATMRVDGVYLIRSDLRPAGPIYTELAEARLLGEPS
jgi:RNA 2',3'-cyclic 3'-phosphodiesterase